MLTFVTSCIIWKSSRDDKRCDKETHMSSYPKWLYPNVGLGGKINKISQACICFHNQDGLFKVMPHEETNAISFLHFKKKVSLSHKWNLKKKKKQENLTWMKQTVNLSHFHWPQGLENRGCTQDQWGSRWLTRKQKWSLSLPTTFCLSFPIFFSLSRSFHCWPKGKIPKL